MSAQDTQQLTQQRRQRWTDLITRLDSGANDATLFQHLFDIGYELRSRNASASEKKSLDQMQDNPGSRFVSNQFLHAVLAHYGIQFTELTQAENGLVFDMETVAKNPVSSQRLVIYRTGGGGLSANADSVRNGHFQSGALVDSGGTELVLDRGNSFPVVHCLLDTTVTNGNCGMDSLLRTLRRARADAEQSLGLVAASASTATATSGPTASTPPTATASSSTATGNPTASTPPTATASSSTATGDDASATSSRARAVSHPTPSTTNDYEQWSKTFAEADKKIEAATHTALTGKTKAQLAELVRLAKETSPDLDCLNSIKSSSSEADHINALATFFRAHNHRIEIDSDESAVALVNAVIGNAEKSAPGAGDTATASTCGIFAALDRPSPDPVPAPVAA
jgi:type II secretory pathway pseudopilin PulG